MKAAKACFIAGLAISFGTGIWHFFVPYLYRWYSYIPQAPRSIVVSIDWINFFFSLILSGNSFLLLLFRRRIYLKEVVSFTFYGFMVFVWLARVILTVVHPWSYDLMWKIQVVAFSIVFLLLLWPFISIQMKCREVT
jgi:hypothetical protein